MTVLAMFTQWILSTSFLVGAYFLGWRSRQDARFLPAAIILFLFAVPVPIIASFFPGTDQLRELTYIKYGPPVAAFLEARDLGNQKNPSETLPNHRSSKNASEPHNARQSFGQLTVENKSLDSEAEAQLKSKNLVSSDASKTDASTGPETDFSFGAGKRNASDADASVQDLSKGGLGEALNQSHRNASFKTANRVNGTGSNSRGGNTTYTGEIRRLNSSGLQSTNIMSGNRSEASSVNISTDPLDPAMTPSNRTQFCLNHLAFGSWRNASSRGSNHERKMSTALADASVKESPSRVSSHAGDGMDWEWDPIGVQQCNFTTRGRLESLGVLARLAYSNTSKHQPGGPTKATRGTVNAKGTALERLDGSVTRIVVAGDSQGRQFALALVRLIRGIAEEELALFQQKHHDWNATSADGYSRVEFWWAPFAANLTERLQFGGPAADTPDVLVMSFGLWHMLYNNDPEEYGRGVRELEAALQETYRIRDDVAPRLFWLNTPALVTERLNTKAKRARLTGPMLRAYNQEAAASGLLRPQGAAVLLDLMNVTTSCGEFCAPDGMHYISEAYRVVVQIMLNAIALTQAG